MAFKASHLTLLCLSGLALLTCPLAFAALGGDLVSVQKDSKKLGAPTNITEHPHYKLHEMNKGPNRVHEYMDSNGKVFGVAWRGKKHPDLRTLMGSHFQEFQAALGEARRHHRHGGTIVVDSGNFHLEMGGHMMAVYGQAWLSDQVPQGMNPHEIQ